MTIVFVNGNPETPAVWGPLLDRLGRGDVELLAPPGFGAPLPPGFDCSPRGYRDWLVGRLEAFGEAVDLVGHDVGGSAVVGERSVAAMLGGDHGLQTRRMVEYGMPEEVAAEVATGHGPDMQRAILSFYRAAAQPVMADLGRDLEEARARPGLAVLGTEDHLVGSEALRRESAARAGARVAVLEGAGHLWMLQAPAAAADALVEHWARGGADVRGAR